MKKPHFILNHSWFHGHLSTDESDMVKRETLGAETVRAARNGDARAWDSLFKRYQVPLFAFIREMTANDATARDLLQETFIAAIGSVGLLRDEGRFGSWLFGIAHNKCAQFVHKQKRRCALEEAFVMDLHDLNMGKPSDEPDSFLLKSEDTERLRHCLSELPESHRIPVVLHWLEEFDLNEIAQILSIPIGTVKSRIHTAKAVLKSKLEIKA